MAYVDGKSGYFEFQDVNKQFTWRINWAEQYDIALNSSIIEVSVDIHSKVYGGRWYPSAFILVNGEQVAEFNYYKPTHFFSANTSGYEPLQVYTSGEPLFSCQSSPIVHNADGTKSITVSVVNNPANHNLSSIQLYRSSDGILRTFGANHTITAELTQIPRAATILSAPDFTDAEGDNPTISFSNPAGNAVDSLSICISLDGETADIAYRDIQDKTASSYTFELTDEEREILQRATLSGSNKRSVYFILKTVIGSTPHYTKLERTVEIVNAEPTIEVHFEDVNSRTLELTGDSRTFIRGYSDLYYNVYAEAYKYASIEKYLVSCGGSSSDQPTDVFESIDATSISFTVVDNRGLPASVAEPITLIPYIKPTCSIQLILDLIESTAAEAIITVSGKVYTGSFGQQDNPFVIEANYTGSGTWVDVTSQGDLIVENDTYSLTFIVPNLDYRYAFSCQCRIRDNLADATSGTEKKSILPTFYWNNDSFFFNAAVGLMSNIILKLLEDKTLVLSNENAPILIRPSGADNAVGQISISRAKTEFSNSVDFKSNTVTGLPTPMNASDAVPKSYADTLKPTVQYPLKYNTEGVLTLEQTDVAPTPYNLDANVDISVNLTEGSLYAITYITNYMSNGDVLIKINGSAPKIGCYSYNGSSGNYSGGIVTYSGSSSAATFWGFIQVYNGNVFLWGNGIRGNGTGHGYADARWDASVVSSIAFNRGGTLLLRKL